MRTRSLHPILVAAVLSLTFLACGTSAHAQWVGSKRKADIAYFLFGTSPRIERLATTNGEWLPAIKLPTQYGPATAFGLDTNALYVAFGQQVKRYSLSGSNEVHVINTADSVIEIFIDGKLLLLNHSSGLYARFTSLNKESNTTLATFENYIYALGGSSIAPSLNKMFGRSTGISPADITFASYQDDGTFSAGGDSPYHGAYPGAMRTWVFPDERKVVDDSGNVYSTGDLTHLNSLGGPFTDVDFYGTDIPIVLRGTTELVAYSNTLLPTGGATLPYPSQAVFVAGTNVLALGWDQNQANGIRLTRVPLSDLNPPKPGLPVDPRGLAYTPDDSFIDRNGVLFLLSKAQQSLFRWDTVSQTYLDTIPLIGTPSFVAYSADNHAVYLAYSTGLIRKIALDSQDHAETPFATLPTAPIGLATADAYVFAADNSGAWGTHYTYNPAGALVDSVDWNYYSREYIWSHARQKMYFFRDDTSPDDLLWEQINADGSTYADQPAGGIGTYMDSPLHDSTGFTHPIRVSPDGTIVVLGSGVIHDATTLARLNVTLGTSINDAAWVDGELRTIREISGLSQLQQWTQPNYGWAGTRQLPGTPLRLLEMGAHRLLGIVLLGQVPSFYVMDGDFNIISPATLEPPSGVVANVISTSQITLSWKDATGEESYSIERRDGATANWTEIGTATTSSTDYVDTTVALGKQYSYRVTARNGSASSAPSAEATASLLPPSVPAEVAAVATSAFGIRVSWKDAEFESSYSLERKPDGAGAWAVVATLPANTVVYADSGLEPGSRYFYRLRAGNGIGTSDYSATADAATDPVPPTVPALYAASAQGPYLVALTWSSSKYEDGYLIERRATGGSWGSVGSVGRDITAYQDSTVQPVSRYEYRVYATNAVGVSDASNIQPVITPQIPAPAAPIALFADPLNSTSVVLTWRDGAYETGYRLERRTENPASWVLAAILPPDTTAYTNVDLVPETRYWFRVIAFNDYGSSPSSNEYSVVPSNVANLIADDFDPGLDATVWASVSGGVATNGITGFRGSKALYFSDAGSRVATTIPIDASKGGSISFQFRAGNGPVDGTALWDNSEAGKSIVLEYSRDMGLNWLLITSLNTLYPALSAWTAVSIPIPATAAMPSTQFRWRQLANSGVSQDTWALDDVVLRGPTPKIPVAVPFILSSPSSSTSIGLYWVGVEGASTYVIERKTGTQPWSAIATQSVLRTYYTDTGLEPSTAHAYRVKAVNGGGSGPYSSTTLSVTWGQWEEWAYANYISLDAMSDADLVAQGPDGTTPLGRYAFNLSADEPTHVLAAGQQSGYPSIWLDTERNRLCVEFVRRKASMNPGIEYLVEFCTSLTDWSGDSTLANVTPIDTLWERVRYEDVAPRSEASMRFCRVSVRR